MAVLDFERPIVELEEKLEGLRRYAEQEGVDLSDQIARLERELERLREEVFSKLTPWQRVQLARHPDRPYALDYINMMTTDFLELHGDRYFGDDPAVVGGLAKLGGRSVVVVGQQKGRGTKENIARRFGMPNPEGYRKALRLMKLGAKFGLPVISLVDTPGAYPGIDAEERGQAEAIARNLYEMAVLPTPIVVVIIGEGGSGGALGMGVGDRILMMENAWYSVIAPESCSSILWRSHEKKEEAAEALKLTAQDLLKLGVVDRVVPEPLGGAHRDPEGAARTLKEVLVEELDALADLPPEELIRRRREKFYRMGVWEE
ncbi:MAG: acetyl-CoA carboxylase carboxyl transferase subunit alpha [Candidatus Latescibacterota bacterium]|nr:MAG: acetyl-CoA carboxylase carboxyl transferase subunit alpha [Candidatus Latescibacterota bacterium]HDI00193.1 acetyl-CoA carboxylase carboxyltransferase subunit alpha [Bacillota bacterium]